QGGRQGRGDQAPHRGVARPLHGGRDDRRGGPARPRRRGAGSNRVAGSPRPPDALDDRRPDLGAGGARQASAGPAAVRQRSRKHESTKTRKSSISCFVLSCFRDSYFAFQLNSDRTLIVTRCDCVNDVSVLTPTSYWPARTARTRHVTGTGRTRPLAPG